MDYLNVFGGLFSRQLGIFSKAFRSDSFGDYSVVGDANGCGVFAPSFREEINQVFVSDLASIGSAKFIFSR